MDLAVCLLQLGELDVVLGGWVYFIEFGIWIVVALG